jgi:hypothetical protein
MAGPVAVRQATLAARTYCQQVLLHSAAAAVATAAAVHVSAAALLCMLLALLTEDERMQLNAHAVVSAAWGAAG